MTSREESCFIFPSTLENSIIASPTSKSMFLRYIQQKQDAWLSCSSWNNTGAICCFFKKRNQTASLKLFILISSYILSPAPKGHRAPCNQSTSFTQTPVLPAPSALITDMNLTVWKRGVFSAKEPPCAGSSVHTVRGFTEKHRAPPQPLLVHFTYPSPKGFLGIRLLLFFISPPPNFRNVISQHLVIQ